MADQTMNLKLRRRPRDGVLFAAFAGCSALGCLSAEAEVAPVRSAGATADEKVLCVDDYVQSIWKGKDVGGPGCADSSAYADRGDELVRGRIDRVCERTEIRTILSGEPSSRFTREACANRAEAYEPATIARACKTASRTLKAREEEFNDAQAAACDRYLRPARSREASVAAARSEQLLASRESSLASAQPGSVAADSGLARFFRNARANAAAGSGVPAVAPAAAAGTAAPSAADLARCEDRYVESIWQGQDLSGSECASYIEADGSTPHYRHARIQNVCDGAAIQAMRRGEPATPFALRACAAALRGHPSPAAADRARAAAEWTAPLVPPGRGLSEEEIAQTVDNNWRSIGRDCLLVAPDSGSQSHASTQISVTMTVSPSGQVRDASARGGRRRRELESCIEGSVRGWRFPAASADTVVAFPLTFVGQ
jgi:hypothetical protein